MPNETKTVETKIAQVCKRKGIDEKTFIVKCMLAGLGYDTGRRLYKGEGGFNLSTMTTAAKVLEVPLSSLVE